MADQIENPTPETPELPGIEGVDEADTQGWDEASKELMESSGVRPPKKEDPSGEQPKPKEGEQKPAASEKEPKGKERVPDPAKQGQGDGDAEGEEGDDASEGSRVDRTAADARVTAREAAKQLAATKDDVRAKLYADRPTSLKDGQGNDINTVEDLMGYNNPDTGKPFTKEEAEALLPKMQAALKQQVDATSEQINQIAELQIQIKDEADIIQDEYGPLLAYPEIRDKIFQDFYETLTIKQGKGPDGKPVDVIVGMPVSLQKFYRNALEPYAELGRRLEAEQAANGEGDGKVEDPGKQAAPGAKPAPENKKPSAPSQADRAKERADRSDIYGGGKGAGEDDSEDAEWAKAAETVFGPRSNYERK